MFLSKDVQLHLLVTVLCAVIFTLNMLSPPDMALGILYVVPIMLCAWLGSRVVVYVYAAIATALVLGEHLIASAHASNLIIIANHLLSIAIIWITALLLDSRIRHEEGLFQANEQINISHKRLVDAIESVPTMMVLLDEQDRFVLCNKEYRDTLKKIEDKLVPGTSFWDISLAGAERGMVEGYQDRPEEWARLRMHRLHNPGLPVLHQQEDGRWVLTADNKMADGSTFITRSDVSAVIEAENALREAESRFRKSQTYANIGTWEWDINEGTLYWSEQIAPLFGYEAGSVETTYENFIAAVHPDDRARVEAAIQSCVNDATEYSIQHRVVWADGSVHWLHEKGDAQRDEDGSAIKMLGAVWDITDQKEYEDTLRKLSSAVQQSPSGVFITDTSGSIEYVNQKFVELTGYQPEEAIGQNPRILKSGNTPKEKYSEMWKTIMSGEVWRGEIMDRHKNGGDFWVHESIAPVKDASGNISHFVAMHEDITKRKEVELAMRSALEQADIANRAKSELMANMSHELRTPLNAVIGFSSSIQEEIFGPLGNKKYLEYIGYIADSGQHLLELINDILDVSAIEAGKLELLEDELDVPTVVEETVRLIRHRAVEGEVDLNVDVEKDIPQIYADARRLKQIMLNMLSNAVKFTNPGGRIDFKVRCPKDGGHIFTISDNGIGMTDEGLSKAMTQFGQVDSSHTRKHEGTGLGLPLTNGLVDLHGARFEISSEKDVGTTINIYFPSTRALWGGAVGGTSESEDTAVVS